MVDEQSTSLGWSLQGQPFRGCHAYVKREVELWDDKEGKKFVPAAFPTSFTTRIGVQRTGLKKQDHLRRNMLLSSRAGTIGLKRAIDLTGDAPTKHVYYADQVRSNLTRIAKIVKKAIR